MRFARLLLAADQAMALQRVAQHIADRMRRVERGIRVLVNDLHQLAIARECLGSHAEDVLATKQDAPSSRPLQTGHHLAGGRLAAAAFANQADDFALGNRERDVVDRRHDLIVGSELAA